METTEQVKNVQMQLESPEQFIGLFGIREENLPLFKDELNVELFIHGNEVTLSGAPDRVDLAQRTLEALCDILRRGESIDRTRIRYAISLVTEGKADRIGEIMRDVIAITYRGRPVKCKTLGQKQYVDAIRDNTCVFAVGPAGTGKTYLAIAMAVVALKNKEIEKIILTRPAVEAGEKLGFLPGDLAQKVDPYLRPLYDALHEMLGVDAYQRLVERGAVEVAPLAYMRGQHAQRRVHHPRRGAEHHVRADEDVPDPHGHGLEDGHHRRRDSDRPADGQAVGSGGGAGGAQGRGRHRHRAPVPPRRGAPRAGAGHRARL